MDETINIGRKVKGKLVKGLSRGGSTNIGYCYLELHVNKRKPRTVLQSLRKTIESKQFSLITRLQIWHHQRYQCLYRRMHK
jgi:hypothetical protein